MERLIASLEKKAKLQLKNFADLDGWDRTDHLAAYAAFSSSCAAIVNNTKPLRNARVPHGDLLEVCRKAKVRNAPANKPEIRRFFEQNFQPFEVIPLESRGKTSPGFLTGYYEPEVAGSLQKTEEFSEPLYSLPDNHVVLDGKENRSTIPKELGAALQWKDRGLRPYPDRASISAGAIADLIKPLVWVRDGIEAFMIHVQGSARISLSGGKVVRLKYAGKNGHPYTSIGRYLVKTYGLEPSELTLPLLKKWIRLAGQGRGDLGRLVMNENKSFIFFQLDSSLKPGQGPIGAAGINLMPLSSIAVDRNLWPYGLPFWIDASLPWQSASMSPFKRLMVAHDTGSAILGPARADIFFGSGSAAGKLAGAIRHLARFHVLLPK